MCQVQRARCTGAVPALGQPWSSRVAVQLEGVRSEDPAPRRISTAGRSPRVYTKAVCLRAGRLADCSLVGYQSGDTLKKVRVRAMKGRGEQGAAMIH